MVLDWLKELFTDEKHDLTDSQEIVKKFDVLDVERLSFAASVGVGNLTIVEGDLDATEIILSYKSNYDYLPRISFEKTNHQAKMKIASPKRKGIIRNWKEEWTITIPKTLPLDVKLSLGVGNQYLDFGSLLLEKLDIESGVGSFTVNLADQLGRNIPVSIDGGVGNMEILLAEDTPAKIMAKKGVGKLRGNGLILAGEHRYTTKAYQQNNPYLDFDINMGVGNITFQID